MKMRLIMASVFIPLGIIIAAIPENKTKPFRLSAEQLLNELKDGTQFVSSDEVADLLIQKDPSLQLIDVRTKDEFDKYSLPGAIHIPLSEILSDQYEEDLDQGVKRNVFYSNGNLKANEAWMLTRQLGYENNFVLQGGLNYWAESILNPFAPKTTMADDEIAKYDFRKGASMVLGGGNMQINTGSAVTKPKTKIKKRKKKKRVAGGC